MEVFEKIIEVRWSDLDPNFHVLHSKYYDFGAFCRMAYFVEQGMTPSVMNELNMGPILFREECVFRKEISFGDSVRINFKITSHTSDFGRWSMTHELFKGNILAGNINVDGAWMDTIKRKLMIPPDSIVPVFENAPKSVDYKVY